MSSGASSNERDLAASLEQLADAGTYKSSTAGKQRATLLTSQRRRPVVKTAGMLTARYMPTGTKVCYADNKVGVLPKLESVLMRIAQEGGIDITNPDTCSLFIEAMVTDVYVNPYSDKQPFDGNIVVGDFEFPRRRIKDVLNPLVGTAYRRFARAMAPLIVEVMHDNYEVFGDVLDKRCTELNLSTRAEAVMQFDGADALVHVDRDTAKRVAEAKHLALSLKSTHKAYSLGDSAKAAGSHEM